jgi:hypothetical protein
LAYVALGFRIKFVVRKPVISQGGFELLNLLLIHLLPFQTKFAPFGAPILPATLAYDSDA